MHPISLAPRIPRHGPYPTLPPGMERDGLVALIDAVAPVLDLGNAALQTLRLMLGLTRPRAFKSGTDEPCCYASQQEIARKRGVTPARIRAHERELERLGLIERRTKANGARSGVSGCGIYFACAIERVEEFLAIRDAREAERREHARLRGQISRHRRRMKEALREIDDQDLVSVALQDVRNASRSWPSGAALQRLPLVALIRLERQVADTSDAAQALLDKHPKTSGRPHENERCHGQDTNKDLKDVPSQPSEPLSRAGPDADPAAASPRNEISGDGSISPARAEKEAAFLGRLTPERLYHLCSESMQVHLDGARLAGRELAFTDFVDAADIRAKELGIDREIWENACRRMGADTAALSLLILDANLDRKWRPVRNPEAYLAAMIRAHQAGRLDVVGGLIGLARRHGNKALGVK